MFELAQLLDALYCAVMAAGCVILIALVTVLVLWICDRWRR